jgi:flagellar biosynthesis protein FliR
MILGLPDFVVFISLLFCRIGTALMLIPGFANPRLPMTVRLLTAVAVTVALLPLLQGRLAQITGIKTLGDLLIAAATEAFTGLVFGFWCYCFLHATRFAASTVASVAGFAGIPGQPIDEVDPTSTLGTLMSLAATLMIFVLDLHLLALRGLINTYEVVPVLRSPSLDWVTENTLVVFRDTSLMALQVAAPFIIYSTIVNFSLGLCSKFTPQLQIYFASMGLTLLLVLALLAVLSPNLLQLPASSYENWMRSSWI